MASRVVATNRSRSSSVMPTVGGGGYQQSRRIIHLKLTVTFKQTGKWVPQFIMKFSGNPALVNGVYKPIVMAGTGSPTFARATLATPHRDGTEQT